MKRCRKLLILLALLFVCIGGVWTISRVTAEYPPLGEAVSYPVNQVEGFELGMEKPSFSPFRGYTLRWQVAAESDDVYYFVQDGEAPNTFEYLECNVNGQWFRLGYLQDASPFTTMEFALGAEECSGLSGSIVQKYAGYGTCLKPGLYRVTLEMREQDGTPHYLAAEFEVE